MSLFVTGNISEERWNTVVTPSDFFYIKGTVETILQRLGLNRLKSSPIKSDIFSEGMSFSLGKKNIVDFGLVKKSVLKHFGVSQNVLFADFNWDNVLEMAKHNSIKFKPIPRYPEVRRDFALLIDNTVSFENIYTIAKQTEKQLLKNVNLFDVYEGDNLAEDEVSYAVSLTLQDDSKTLNEKQIEQSVKRILDKITDETGARLRD